MGIDVAPSAVPAHPHPWQRASHHQARRHLDSWSIDLLDITCNLTFKVLTTIVYILHLGAESGMWVRWARCARRVVRHDVKAPKRLLSTQPSQAELLSKTTRNIGIVAHIDAVSYHVKTNEKTSLTPRQGKTTTTERMLYYCGHTRRIGSKWFRYECQIQW